jgi:NAD(P)-dependent dehydrogenase (short-subunit alcohol dehydrogenase family)
MVKCPQTMPDTFFVVKLNVCTKPTNVLCRDRTPGRAAQPFEIAPAFVYLTFNDSAYVTGQVLHINGGEILNS